MTTLTGLKAVSCETTTETGTVLSSTESPQGPDQYQEYLDMMESLRFTDLSFKKPRYENHPRAIMSTVRCAHEFGHHRQQRHDWIDAPCILDVQAQPPSPQQCYDFCWKDCALYSTTPIVYPGSDDLVNYIWNKWFQGDATNIDHENFVIKHIKAYSPESPKRLPEMIEAHRAISLQVDRRIAGLDMPGRTTGGLYDYHTKYNFLSSFKKVFIIVDSLMWYREGVLLVTSDKSSSFDIEAATTNFDIPEFSVGDQGRAVRISLEKALRCVTSISNAAIS